MKFYTRVVATNPFMQGFSTKSSLETFQVFVVIYSCKLCFLLSLPFYVKRAQPRLSLLQVFVGIIRLEER
jgi:hypothetical protein